jgi:hypothetical protein
LFKSWAEVQEYVENDAAGQDLKAIVQLVEKYGTDTIIQAVDRLSTESDANVTVSTAHKAKGREWSSVCIGHGFTAPPVDDHGIQRPLNLAETRLIYVAVTRACHLLDIAGISWIDDYEKAAKNAPGTLGGRPMIELSLVAQLRHNTSPVSRFMARHLPRSGILERDYLQRLKNLPHPVQPLDVQYPSWSALGHAIDYRLRLSFGASLGRAVTMGVIALDSIGPLAGAPAPPVRQALTTAGRQLLETIDTFLADPGHLNEEHLVRLCFVAAFFEDVYRTGQVRRRSMLTEATSSTTLAHLVAAVPDYVIDDVADQMKLAVQTLAPFRALSPRAKISGPEFTGSSDLGGADADYILGGLLLDCKATTDPRRLGREEIYQLAGYLLLDYHDEYGINRVGLYLSRQGGLITWTTHEFLHHLGATHPLPQLRAKLRSHLRIAGRTMKGRG